MIFSILENVSEHEKVQKVIVRENLTKLLQNWRTLLKNF